MQTTTPWHGDAAPGQTSSKPGNQVRRRESGGPPGVGWEVGHAGRTVARGTFAVVSPAVWRNTLVSLPLAQTAQELENVVRHGGGRQRFEHWRVVWPRTDVPSRIPCKNVEVGSEQNRLELASGSRGIPSVADSPMCTP